MRSRHQQAVQLEKGAALIEKFPDRNLTRMLAQLLDPSWPNGVQCPDVEGGYEPMVPADTAEVGQANRSGAVYPPSRAGPRPRHDQARRERGMRLIPRMR
jgi:hypothetical protein